MVIFARDLDGTDALASRARPAIGDTTAGPAIFGRALPKAFPGITVSLISCRYCLVSKADIANSGDHADAL